MTECSHEVQLLAVPLSLTIGRPQIPHSGTAEQSSFQQWESQDSPIIKPPPFLLILLKYNGWKSRRGVGTECFGYPVFSTFQKWDGGEQDFCCYFSDLCVMKKLTAKSHSHPFSCSPWIGGGKKKRNGSAALSLVPKRSPFPLKVHLILRRPPQRCYSQSKHFSPLLPHTPWHRC